MPARAPAPGSLIDRRGAALAPPILLAAVLSLGAVTGLAYIAGFSAVYTSLTRIQWPWLCAVPAALALAFGLLMNGAALIVGYCTGMVITRRTAPLAGAGTLTLILPLTIWASGAPLATAIIGVAACRQLGGWLSLPPALASLPVLRETTRQAAG